MRPGILALMGRQAAGGSLSGTFLTSASNSSGLSTYTFASRDLGAAASDRQIVAVVVSHSNAGVTLSSVTIGGVSATIDANELASDTSRRVTIARAAVPTGATGDVVITFGASAARCSVGLYRITGATATVGATNSAATTSTTFATTIQSTVGGVVIAGATNGSSSNYNEVDWTGGDLTEDWQLAMGSLGRQPGSGASDLAPSGAVLDAHAVFSYSAAGIIVAVAYSAA